MINLVRTVIANTEIVNAYGVRIVNNLIEEYKISAGVGYPYDKQYLWEQTMIQKNGDKFTRSMAKYKRLSAMEKAMRKNNFWMKEEA